MPNAPHHTTARGRARVARDERLARALRDNLRRRKEQTRVREPRAADRPADEKGGDESPA